MLSGCPPEKRRERLLSHAFFVSNSLLLATTFANTKSGGPHEKEPLHGEVAKVIWSATAARRANGPSEIRPQKRYLLSSLPYNQRELANF